MVFRPVLGDNIKKKIKKSKAILTFVEMVVWILSFREIFSSSPIEFITSANVCDEKRNQYKYSNIAKTETQYMVQTMLAMFQKFKLC